MQSIRIKNTLMKTLLAALTLLLAGQCFAVQVEGKTSSRVTAQVIRHEWITVSAPGDTWYDQPQELIQWGTVGTPYTLDLPVIVEANVPEFLVSLDSPVELVNQANSSLRFSDVSVSFGNEAQPWRELGTTPEKFSNAGKPTPDDTFMDTWLLKVAAKPPTGDVSSAVGRYLGTMALTFEPVAVAP